MRRFGTLARRLVYGRICCYFKGVPAIFLTLLPAKTIQNSNVGNYLVATNTTLLALALIGALFLIFWFFGKFLTQQWISNPKYEQDR